MEKVNVQEMRGFLRIFSFFILPPSLRPSLLLPFSRRCKRDAIIISVIGIVKVIILTNRVLFLSRTIKFHKIFITPRRYLPSVDANTSVMNEMREKERAGGGILGDD